MKKGVRHKNENGIAIVIVLWVMAILLAITAESAFTMRVHSEAAMNFRDGAAAYYMAFAGVNLAIKEITAPYDVVYLGSDSALTFGRTGKDGALTPNEKERTWTAPTGAVSYSIEDESGKLNLNTAGRQAITSLLRSSGVETADRDIIADSVLDWIDEDQEYRMNGAEGDYYRALPKGYSSKDSEMDFVEELLLVRGMTPGIFYGAGKVPFGIYDAGKDAGQYPGIAGLVTAKGDGGININAADRTVLKAAFGEERAEKIFSSRAASPGAGEPGAKTSSAIFSVTSTGESNGMSFTIKAVLEKKGSGIAAVYWSEEGAGPY